MDSREDTMMRLSRVTRLAATVLTPAIAGCASMAVSSYMPRDQDLAQYRTYQWEPVDEVATGDPRLDNNWFFDERVRAAVDRQLAARRLEKAPLEKVDLVVHYHASVTQAIDVRGVHPEYKYCETEDCGPYVYEAGTLLIDRVDARTQQLVWRGWAEAVFDDVIDNQRSREVMVDDTVKRIFQRLPQTF
jgi:hypothetical protein